MSIRKTYPVCRPGSRNKGFTLVELIVVIAILAVLSGIAIPAYSNYIRRANEASDRQLIGAVNMAFAAACLENGYDHTRVQNAELVYNTEDGKTYIVGLQNVIFDGKNVTEQINASFLRYFGANADTPLKYYTEDEISFRFFGGIFDTSESEGEELKVIIINGQPFYYTAAQMRAFTSSNFNIEDDTWGETINRLVGAVDSNINTRDQLNSDEAFKSYLVSIGVIETAEDDISGVPLGQNLSRFVASRLAELTSEDAAQICSILSSHPADGVESMEEIAALISSSGPDEQVAFSDKAVAAALIYSMTGAYLNSEYGDSDSSLSWEEFMNANISDRGSFSNYYDNIDENVFSNYLSEYGKADLDGFLSLMQLLNNNNLL